MPGSAGQALGEPEVAQESPNHGSHGGVSAARARAEALLERSRTDVSARQEAFQTLERALEGALPLLGAISRGSSPPAELVPAIVSLLDHPDPALALGALDAIGAYNTRSAVRPIVERLADPALADSERAHFTSVLIEQTGLEGHGADRAAWSAWWQTAQFLTEAEWNGQIARAQSARARSLDAANEVSRLKLESMFRRLHRLASEEERPELLAEMLGDPQPGVRDLGLELTTRRLLNARPIDDGIVRALVGLIGDPDVDRRASAARILARLGRADGSAQITSALTVETDPVGADALLRAGAVRPDPSQVAAALPWLEGETIARPAAAALIASAIASNIELSPGQRQRVDDYLGAIPDGRVSEEDVDLLTALGRGARLVGLLNALDRVVAQRAGSALVDAGGHVDALAEASTRHPDLAPLALRAIESEALDPDGLRTAMSIADLSDPRLLEQVVRIARALAPWQLMSVAQAFGDLDGRALLLGAVLDRQYVAHPGDEFSRARLVMLAARTELARGAPDRALRRLESLSPDWNGPAVQVLRIESLARAGRVEDAIDLSESAARDGAATPASIRAVWLEFVGAIEDDVAAMAVVATLRARLGATIDERFDRAVDSEDVEPGQRADSAEPGA